MTDHLTDHSTYAIVSMAVGEGSDIVCIGSWNDGDIWSTKEGFNVNHETNIFGLSSASSMVYDAFNDNFIIGGTYSQARIWRASKSDLTNWTQTAGLTVDSAFLGELYVASMLYIPSGSGVLLAGTGNNGEIWKSTDGGDVWTQKEEFKLID